MPSKTTVELIEKRSNYKNKPQLVYEFLQDLNNLLDLSNLEQPKATVDIETIMNKLVKHKDKDGFYLPFSAIREILTKHITSQAKPEQVDIDKIMQEVIETSTLPRCYDDDIKLRNILQRHLKSEPQEEVKGRQMGKTLSTLVANGIITPEQADDINHGVEPPAPSPVQEVEIRRWYLNQQHQKCKCGNQIMNGNIYCDRCGAKIKWLS